MKTRTPASEILTAHAAFTLLEVMIATGIFFMAMFAILGLVAGTLTSVMTKSLTRAFLIKRRSGGG